MIVIDDEMIEFHHEANDEFEVLLGAEERATEGYWFVLGCKVVYS